MSHNRRRNFLKMCGLSASALMVSPVLNSKIMGNSMPVLNTENNYFGLSKEEIRKLLDIALSRGGEFSELFFEYNVTNSINLQEDIVKSSSESISLGVGVRVIKGRQTGYGYTNELTFEKIKSTALAAAAIADGNATIKAVDLNNYEPKIQTYDMQRIVSKEEINSKINLIRQTYDAAIAYDSRITRASVNLLDNLQFITIANSEGLLISDLRPQVRLICTATAESNGRRSTGNGNDGGRVGYDFFINTTTPKQIGEKAAKEAMILLDSDNAPAGEIPVVLSKHQSGVMIHEAVGHPMEADSNWKGTSVMSDKLNQIVGNEQLTIYDDATIPYYRGSLNIDDEGVQTENVVLIENGRLVNYLHDRLSAKIMNVKPNGHGRRETYMHIPIPRMNNTVLASGKYDPQEIIESIDHGFYAETYQGGQVANTGKFTFSVNLGYLIEKGKLTRPLRNATLIGSNIDILMNVDMVGSDMGFFLGNCGKQGQTLPVTAGTPSLRIKRMTVGGVA